MYSDITNCAIDAAKEAGRKLRSGYGTAFQISSKEGKNNLVTEYDHAAEKIIIDMIKERFPEHQILAEESGYSGSEDENQVLWVIDPLDGTVNFAHAIPIFSVSIAAVRNKEILCGVIYHPILDELFVAEKGNGATLNGEAIHVSETKRFENSMLVTGFPYNVNQNPCGCIDHFVDIIKQGIPIRRLGSAALDLAYVACGRFDGFWEINLHPWDVAAGVLLVQEAGGRISQYNDADYWIDNESILSSNGIIHEDISKVLNKCKCGVNYAD
jgi:myo-inositol-1(or 4)-monophosphatase